ncbi:MAG: type IV pilus assembly protein PilM [Candidatus Omnitrophica bacterium]|nr:type IV pilus assembly protein PilM [Candidatus Omnitrophota bacterium]
MIGIISKYTKRFSRDHFVAGLDVGSASVKVVKLKVTGQGSELCGFFIDKFESSAVDAINKIKERLGQVDRINFSVEGPSTIIRYVNFPLMSAEELKKALKFEAQKHIPFSLQEINLDGCILSQDLPDNKMLVLLAAAKKELIEQRLKFINDAGLKPGAIDLDSLALVNAFCYNYPVNDDAQRKTTVLLNIGSSFSNLNILEGDLPRFSRDIHIASNNFNHRIMEMFGVDFKSAESLKVDMPQEKSEQIVAAFDSVMANLATELRISFDYYESQTSSAVGRIFISGGGSIFPGLKESLANLLGIEVEYWDPFNKIGIAASVDVENLKKHKSELAVAAGLALR